jgi:hypothetical protein
VPPAVALAEKAVMRLVALSSAKALAEETQNADMARRGKNQRRQVWTGASLRERRNFFFMISIWRF